MATLTPKEQADQAKVRAQELMDINNAASAETSDQLLSILEAGKGTGITRTLLDQYLHNYVTTRITRGRLASLNYDRTCLRKFLSIKEKVAYATGLLYAAEGLNQVPQIRLASSRDTEDERLRITLNQIIINIEKDVINNRDFTESRILRNAAANRFECKCSDAETIRLNAIGNKIKAVCVANGLDDLEEATHFTHESDAQKILKFSDALAQMSAMGVNLDPKLLKEFEPFNEKIKPLRDLDKHYKHVTKTLNMLHRVAQKGYHSMIRRVQKEKLDQVLQKLNLTKTVNDELTKFNKIENFDKNDEHGFLDNLIARIQAHPQFKQTIYSMAISEAKFNERFFSSCAYTLTNAAKLGLNTQKGTVFGDRLPKFEEDAQSRRGMVRGRIFDIADRMGMGGDFVSEADFRTADSYFDKFRDLFFAKEEDNYLHGAPNAKTPSELHYHKMEKVISALVRRRVPALASSHRIRRGSAGRIVYKFIENGLKGKDRGFYQWARRVRHRADDSSVVAMVIMAQNEATNQMFYQDQDKTKKADSRWGKLWSKVSFTEHGRRAIRDKISPAANKALTFTEEAVKKGLQLSKGAAKVGNKVLSKTTRALTRSLGAVTGKFNTMIKKGGYKRWKTPLYLPYLLTRPTETIMKYGYKGATYTDRMGNKHIDTVGKAVSQGYDEAKKLVGKATGQQTSYLFQGLTYATEQATSLVGKTISATGQRVYDNYTVGQQRGILGAFYSAAKEQKGLEDLMQSSELGEMLNLKVRGPRMFDDDGRVVTTERIKVKEKDSPEEAGKELATELQNQMRMLIEQADNEVRKAQKDHEKAIQEDNENKKIQAETNVEEKGTLRQNINNVNISISALLPILRDAVRGGARRHADIRDRIGVLAGGPPPAFPVGTIRHAIAEITGPINIAGLQADVNARYGERREGERRVKSRSNSIKEMQRSLSGDLTDIEREALIGRIAAQEAELSLESAAETASIIAHNQAMARLSNAQQRLGLLQKIDQVMARISALNDEMHAAAGNKDRQRETSKEILELARNLDLLLHPQEKKKEENIDVSSLSDEAAKKLLEELNKKFAPTT